MIDQELKTKVESLKRRYKSILGDHLAKDFYAPCLLASNKLNLPTHSRVRFQVSYMRFWSVLLPLKE